MTLLVKDEIEVNVEKDKSVKRRLNMSHRYKVLIIQGMNVGLGSILWLYIRRGTEMKISRLVRTTRNQNKALVIIIGKRVARLPAA